jgi:hypothetical protein
MTRRWAAATAVAAVVAGSPALLAGQRAPDALPRGIFVYREQLVDDGQFDRALGVAGVDGMALVLDWSALQPSRDAFETAAIDSQLAMAKRHHVPIELVIRAGRGVPSWVAPDARLALAYSNHAGLGACLAVDMPPPWNPNFQSAFKAIVRRTADYVTTHGADVAAVKLTGINATSEELRLPSEPPEATKGCAGGPIDGAGGSIDDVAVWQKAGYTPSKLERAFDGLVTSFDEIFPGTPVAVALIPARPFPPIDDRRQIVRGKDVKTLNDRTLQAMTASAAKTLGGRLILQHDFLMYNQPADPDIMALARAHGAAVAWQTNLWRGNLKEGAACGGAPQQGTACTDQQYLAMLETGIRPAGGQGASARGLYIEVFPFDVLAHPGPIARAHEELTTRRP